MNIISVDLGTTNIKAAVYDHDLHSLDILSEPVAYRRQGEKVEFNAEEYGDLICDLVSKAALTGKKQNGEDVSQIVLTGQAESLVLLGEDQQPVCPALSWLDMRSGEECNELARVFPEDKLYHITGQPAFIPTWPITKLLWFKHHQPVILQDTKHILLLKDYIILRLSGEFAEEYSISSFSCYFDIQKKQYWDEILDYCGIEKSKLPPLVPSGTIVGPIIPALRSPGSGLTENTRINVGTLDHFAGMIGTGNIQTGSISESAGTVLSIAALVSEPVFREGLPNYCGPFPDTYVLLPVCESGGFSMEWYKNQFLQDISYAELNEKLTERKDASVPLFLPYLTGVNPPEYDENATGVFFGLKAEHTRFDMALSVMQGVACMLRKNLEYMTETGVPVSKITSTGGGARSPIWCQIKSDFSGQAIEVPISEEAPCLGAAIIGAVSEGYCTYDEAIERCVAIRETYTPAPTEYTEKTYQLFCKTYDALKECFVLNGKRV